MGSGEKKRRRELNRTLGGYSYVYNGRRYPLHAGAPAADMLIEFAAPLGELLSDPRTMVALAVFSWNISLAPEAERPALIDEFVAPMFRENPQTLETVHSIVEAMIDRRIRFYAREPIYYVANEGERGREAAAQGAAAGEEAVAGQARGAEPASRSGAPAEEAPSTGKAVPPAGDATPAP